ncbi:MAG: GNAT family N-acetyltransferase [Oscillospiraceae bacterium]|nr:GNAT family N-acetyltransferase [Oscillospiraceae bacterium]
MIQNITDKNKKEDICHTILTALPEWFEIPESIEEYALSVREMPLWADIENDTCRGFISLRETSAHAAEIYVMGVRKEYHRNGIGRALFAELCSYAAAHGYEFIHVKTVAQGFYADYDLTNAFYRSIGFKELECLESLWGKENPCQIYIMAIKNRRITYYLRRNIK